MIQSRRSFLTGLGAAFIAAPAIVRAGSLMPVKAMLSDGVALTNIAHPINPMDMDNLIIHCTERIAYQWVDVRVFDDPQFVAALKSIERGGLRLMRT